MKSFEIKNNKLSPNAGGPSRRRYVSALGVAARSATRNSNLGFALSYFGAIAQVWYRHLRTSR
jgi:hypothetical protein